MKAFIGKETLAHVYNFNLSTEDTFLIETKKVPVDYR